MKKALVFLILLLFVSQVGAQQWNEEEQAVLDTIRLCWDVWAEAVAKKDFDIWVEKCPMEENYSMWWTNLAMPATLETDQKNADMFIALEERWLAIQPVAVKVHGDTALVQFYGLWQPKLDGRRVTTEYKRTEVFIKRDGQWRFIGGQGSPTSPSDAVPYE